MSVSSGIIHRARWAIVPVLTSAPLFLPRSGRTPSIIGQRPSTGRSKLFPTKEPSPEIRDGYRQRRTLKKVPKKRHYSPVASASGPPVGAPLRARRGRALLKHAPLLTVKVCRSRGRARWGSPRMGVRARHRWLTASCEFLWNGQLMKHLITGAAISFTALAVIPVPTTASPGCNVVCQQKCDATWNRDPTLRSAQGCYVKRGKLNEQARARAFEADHRGRRWPASQHQNGK